MLIISLSFYACSDDDGNLVSTNFYYLANETEITALETPNNNLTPTAITIANDKLYVCNPTEVLVFDLNDYNLLQTITTFKKGTTEIALTQLTSISIHNGKIYLGSQESRLFVLDQETYNGITFLGNGQWWQTFVHVFGVTVTDEYVFVKEKNSSLKIFETAAINENTNWNLAPVAKLDTNNGYIENYSLKVEDYNLVIAGRDAKSFLYYNIASIKSNAVASLKTPYKPRVFSLGATKPVAVDFNDTWAFTIENTSGKNFIKMYPKKDFMFMKYTPIVNSNSILGGPAFGDIVDIASYNDLILVADKTNNKIQILKIKSSKIQEK